MANKDLENKIDRLVAVMERIAAPIPAIPAIAPIQPIPAIPPIVHSGDHDLLVKLDTKLEAVSIAIGGLATKADLINHVIDDNKQHGGDGKRLDDLEIRMRAGEKVDTRIMTWGAAILLFMTIGQFLLGYLWK